MTTHGIRRLEQVIAGQVESFALLRRAENGFERVELLIGKVCEPDSLAELTDLESHRSSPTGGVAHQVLAALPYRQITERGFDCIDDHAPLLALTIHEQYVLRQSAVLSATRGVSLPQCQGGFDITDEEYAQRVARVLTEEIDNGQGANFVIRRTFEAHIEQLTPEAVLAIFSHLLLHESSAYWTFVMFTPQLILIGASPEIHVRVRNRQLVMNPISGTLRHSDGPPTVDQTLAFLDDRKEIEELSMVLDEELKIMAAVCDRDVLVHGPRLKSMSNLTHTEYLLTGHTEADPWTLLRATMFCPTVTGSPLENATRVIARHEDTGRGYYSGALVLLGRDAHNQHYLDSTILIRTAEVDPEQHTLRVGVGCTLVRHSDGTTEALETRAKAKSILSALGVRDAENTRGAAQPVSGAKLVADSPAIQRVLAARRSELSSFWLSEGPPAVSDTTIRGRSVLVLDAEDRFTTMLATVLRSLGMLVTVRPCTEDFDPTDFDLVVTGPGPGDPDDSSDQRIQSLRVVTERLLETGRPVLAVCLSHQVMARVLGFQVRRRAEANQGTQREVDLFGARRRVGFYNSFAAFASRATSHVTQHGPVEVSLWGSDNEVVALRGQTFASVQFHPESVLTIEGREILAGLIGPMLSSTWQADARHYVKDGGPAATVVAQNALPGSAALDLLSHRMVDREFGGLFQTEQVKATKRLRDQAAAALAFAQYGEDEDVHAAMSGLSHLRGHDGHPGFISASTRRWSPLQDSYRGLQEQLFAATAFLACAYRTDDLGAQACAVDLINRCLSWCVDGALPECVKMDWSTPADARAGVGPVIAAVQTLAWTAVLGEDLVDRTMLPMLVRRLVATAQEPNTQASLGDRARLSLALTHAGRLLGDEKFRTIGGQVLNTIAFEHGHSAWSVPDAALVYTAVTLAADGDATLSSLSTHSRSILERALSPSLLPERRMNPGSTVSGVTGTTLMQSAVIRAVGHETTPMPRVGGVLAALM